MRLSVDRPGAEAAGRGDRVVRRPGPGHRAGEVR